VEQELFTGQAFFEACVRQYPDSVLGYRLLYKTLYESGQTDKAEDMFNKYAAVLKKEILGK